MTVFHLISSGGFYGAESMVIALTSELKERVTTALAVFRNHHSAHTEVADEARRRRIPVELIDCRGRFDWRAIVDIRKRLQAVGAEIVHTHGYKAALYGYLATWGLPAVRVITQHTEARWDQNSVLSMLYHCVNRFVLSQSTCVVAVSESVQVTLQASGVDRGSTRVIHNGVELERFAAKSGAAAFSKRVGIVGRLIASKGHAVLFMAAQRVLQQHPDATFLVIGEGPELAALQHLVNRLGIAKAVSFLGHVSEMASLYATLDVVVLPSFVEGLPMTIIEALGAAKAVVASHVGGIPLVIRDRQTGILVSPGDADALTAAINELLNDPALCREFGRHGAELVRDRFSSRAMADAYLSLYNDLLGNATYRDAIQ